MKQDLNQILFSSDEFYFSFAYEAFYTFKFIIVF